MLRYFIAAALALVFASAADARPRAGMPPAECGVSMPCEGAERAAPTLKGYGEAIARGSVSLAGVVGPLAAKAREIQSACGGRVISAVRKTFIAGTRHISLHASGRAVDMAGNPACIYARLRDWPGGVSVDYGRVAHVHFSYALEGREWGLRFRHGGGKAKKKRNAKLRKKAN